MSNLTTEQKDRIIHVVQEIEKETSCNFQVELTRFGQGKSEIIYSFCQRGPYLVKMNDEKYSDLDGEYKDQASIEDKIKLLIKNIPRLCDGCKIETILNEMSYCDKCGTRILHEDPKNKWNGIRIGLENATIYKRNKHSYGGNTYGLDRIGSVKFI